MQYANSRKVMKYFFTSGREPEQGFKYCVSLKKTADRYGQHRLEKVCVRPLAFTSQPSFWSIVTILKNGQGKLPMESPMQDPEKPVKRNKGITREAGAYREGGKASC